MSMFVKMSNRVIFSFIIMIMFTKEWVSCDEKICEIWGTTVKIVPLCPSNGTNIENKNKNCQQYAEKAKLNNCTDYTKIRYHCVLNSYGNQTIEVCAPEKRINGFCTEFNEEVGKILPNHYLDCLTFRPNCRSHYNSAEAYIYKTCYNHTNNEMVFKRIKYGNITTQKQPRNNISPSPSLTSNLPSYSTIEEPIQTITNICIVILLFVTLTLIVMLPKWFRYIKEIIKCCENNRRGEDNPEEQQEMNREQNR